MGKRRNMDTMTTVFTDNAKVMPKGQVTIPKDVRKALGVGRRPGDLCCQSGRGENDQFSGLCDETLAGRYGRAGRSSRDSARGRCSEAC